MLKPFKVTKKRLVPFLDERGLELAEYNTSYIHYYYLKVKGSSVFQSEYHDKTHFYKLKNILDFLLANPSFNNKSIIT